VGWGGMWQRGTQRNGRRFGLRCSAYDASLAEMRLRSEPGSDVIDAGRAVLLPSGTVSGHCASRGAKGSHILTYRSRLLSRTVKRSNPAMRLAPSGRRSGMGATGSAVDFGNARPAYVRSAVMVDQRTSSGCPAFPKKSAELPDTRRRSSHRATGAPQTRGIAESERCGRVTSGATMGGLGSASTADFSPPARCTGHCESDGSGRGVGIQMRLYGFGRRHRISPPGASPSVGGLQGIDFPLDPITF
jgi:hypothetical protein